MKNINKLLSFLLILAATSTMAQNQKVWTGTSKLFGIDGTTNPTSTASWSIGNGTGSTTSKLDTTTARTLFSRYSWVNGTAAIVVDTVKVSETLSGCVSTITSKLVEVYPLPSLSFGSNQTLCAGIAPSNITLTISNYSAIANIGPLNLSYELRAGSAGGTALGGSSTATITNITSGTVNINTATWPALTANTTYYLIITSFGSDIATAGANPAPGYVSTTSVSGFPQTYTITVQPPVSAPTINAY